jgi:hypothetical protein
VWGETAECRQRKAKCIVCDFYERGNLLLALQIATLLQSCIRRAQVKVGLINLCKGLFSLNARIYYKLKSGT